MSGFQTLPGRTGTVIIGAGTAGAVCASVLAEAGGDSVSLLEAGPDYGAFSDNHWPADLLDARSIPTSHDWHLDSGNSHPKRVINFSRARVVGGCSSHNGCTAAIGARADYDAWAANGNVGWSAKEIEPLFDWVRDRLRVRTYTMDELTHIQASFVAAGVACGLRLAFDLDRYEAGVGIGP